MVPLHLLKPLLFPVTFFYRMGLAVDRWQSSRHATRLPKFVLSIGNLTLGGTGKTPLLIRLCHDLKAQHVTPAILTRGYGADEVEMMSDSLKGMAIGVGGDRVRSAQELLKTAAPDLFILDDGFQHWRLQRDADVVCVDATDPWGGGAMLPAGRLREPREGLKRATLVVLTRTELLPEESIQNITRDVQRFISCPVIECRFSLRFSSWPFGGDLDAERLSSRRALAVSAIGNPSAFEANLKQLGFSVESHRYLDHHVYTERDLQKLESAAAGKDALFVITEKDAVKLKKTRWGKEGGCPAPVYLAKQELLFPGANATVWEEHLAQWAASARAFSR